MRSPVGATLLAVLALSLSGCEYVRLLRPSVLKQLNPDVVRLVNTLPAVDDPNGGRPVGRRRRAWSGDRRDHCWNGNMQINYLAYSMRLLLGVPLTGTDAPPAGYQVSRIDLSTGEAEPFFRTRPEALGPEGAESVVTSGPKHPVDVRFSRDGSSLYVTDLGALTVYLAGAGPFPRTFPVSA